MVLSPAGWQWAGYLKIFLRIFSVQDRTVFPVRCRTLALPQEYPTQRPGKRAQPDPTFGASRRCNAYNERKKSNKACWSAGDSIAKLAITVLASEPLLA